MNEREQHGELADELEDQADTLADHNRRLGEEIADVRQDHERRRADAGDTPDWDDPDADEDEAEDQDGEDDEEGDAEGEEDENRG